MVQEGAHGSIKSNEKKSNRDFEKEISSQELASRRDSFPSPPPHPVFLDVEAVDMKRETSVLTLVP